MLKKHFFLSMLKAVRLLNIFGETGRCSEHGDIVYHKCLCCLWIHINVCNVNCFQKKQSYFWKVLYELILLFISSQCNVQNENRDFVTFSSIGDGLSIVSLCPPERCFSQQLQRDWWYFWSMLELHWGQSGRKCIRRIGEFHYSHVVLH